MTDKKFMYKNMTEKGTHHRAEQLLLAKLLRSSFYVKGVYDVRCEYPVLYENEDGKKSGAILDIAMIPHNVLPPIGIRMNGRIHEKKRNKLRDEDQRRYLELVGWIIYDIDENICPEYWQPKGHSRKELMAITESIFSWT